MTMTSFSMRVTLGSFCNDVLITKLLSTPASSNMQNLKCSLQGSFCRQMDTERTDAIEQFPTPTNRTDLRSFFGLVNQLSACTDTIDPLLAPLRPLLSIKNDFVWTPTMTSWHLGRLRSHLPPHLPFPFLMLTGKHGVY